MTTPAPSPRIRRAPPPKERAGKKSLLLKWSVGAPSLLAIALSAIAFALCATQRADQTRAHYARQADAALDSRDFQTARICYERLLQSDPKNQQLQFGLSRALVGGGKVNEGYILLNRIAPADAPGYPPAQLFLAQQLLYEPHTPLILKTAEEHLQRVLDQDPDNAEAKAMLATARRSIKSHPRK
jgi:predicted Zn-dependent protease